MTAIITGTIFSNPEIAGRLEELGIDGETAASIANVSGEVLDEALGPDLSEAARQALAEVPPGNELEAFTLTPAAMLTLLRMRLADLDEQMGTQIEALQNSTRLAERINARVQALNLIQSAMASQHSNPDGNVRLDELEVTFQGETMTADELLNRLGIDDFPVSGTALTDREIELEDEVATTKKKKKKNRRRFRWVRSARLRKKEKRQRRELRDVRELRAAEEARVGESLADTYTGNQTINSAGLEAYISRLQSQARQANSGNEMRMVTLQSLTQQRSQSISLTTQMLRSIHESERAIAGNIGR